MPRYRRHAGLGLRAGISAFCRVDTLVSTPGIPEGGEMSNVVRFNITKTIVCGETTCASAPGKFCDYAVARKFGLEPVCIAFDEPIPLYDHDGWLQRCQACLDAEKGIEMETVWHSGPPPSVGWWPASLFKDKSIVRWWNGKVWSVMATPGFTAREAGRAATLRGYYQDLILWTERWWV